MCTYLFKTDGIYLIFSKYMDVGSLTADSFHLYNSDGSKADFDLVCLNKEKAPENIDYSGATPEYVSRIKLKPMGASDPSFTTGNQMLLTISGNAASYAGTVLGKQKNVQGIVTEKTDCATPVFKIKGSATNGGNVPDSTVLEISCDPEEFIIYTTDGTDPDENSIKRYKSGLQIAIDSDMTVKAIAVRDGYNKSGIKSATFTVYRKSDMEVSRKEAPVNPTDDRKQQQEETDDGYETSEAITVGEDSYVVKWTRSVSYNGLKHIEVGGKGGKSKATDMDIFILKNGTEEIRNGFKVKFRNNQYVNGYKGKPAPYFSLTFKGKGNKAVKQAFKSLKFEFDILPAELMASKLSVKKAVVKNGKIKLSGLKYSGGAKAVKLKPQKGSKGDYTATLSDNSIILTGVNNFYGTAVISAQVSEPKEEKEEKAQ